MKQNLKYHPEGDALYHSLQVFDLARDALPYDEEFLLAALLHDVGKAIDPHDHVAAGLEALDGFITERTAWLIEHHMDAQQDLDGTLGARARRRLQGIARLRRPAARSPAATAPAANPASKRRSWTRRSTTSASCRGRLGGKADELLKCRALLARPMGIR